jgi:hypothetical protein
MQQWTEVRRRVLTGELSKRAACREYELSWPTLEKMLTHAEPPGYRMRQHRKKRRFDPFLPINAELERRCRADFNRTLYGKSATKQELLPEEHAAMRELPSQPFDTQHQRH